MFDIVSIARWLRKTEGRDKLCKVLQYVCRILAAFHTNTSEYKTLIYSTLFRKFCIMKEGLREARKLFRIFKSIDQFQTIKRLVFEGDEGVETILQICYHTCYYFYWMIDNISVTAMVGIFKLDWHLIYRFSLKVRCVALVISILAFLYHKPKTEEEKYSARLKAVSNITDLLPVLKDSGLFLHLNEQMVGFGGLISSLVSTYQIYSEK